MPAVAVLYTNKEVVGEVIGDAEVKPVNATRGMSNKAIRLGTQKYRANMRVVPMPMAKYPKPKKAKNPVKVRKVLNGIRCAVPATLSKISASTRTTARRFHPRL